MPFETDCPDCGRLFKLKDELLGKKFKCSDCGSVVVAKAILPAVPVEPATEDSPPPRKKTSRPTSPSRQKNQKKTSAPNSARRPSRTASNRPAPAKKKRPARPKRSESAYDEYDDYSNDFGDFGDEGAYDDPYGAPAPRRSSKKPTKGKAQKRKKKKSSFSPSFNVNRLNLAMAGIALAIGFYGLSEARLASKAKSEPSKISLNELIANGTPENIHLTVTDAKADIDEYVFEYRGTNEDRYTKVYVPCRSRSSNNQRVGMVLMSTSLDSHFEVQPLGTRREFTGMIVNEIRSLKKDELEYLNSIPGVNAGSVILFELDRKPSSVGSLILYFLAAAALLGGALFWMFFSGS